jgi:probable H4MPT-linked C1 transfer pathway protein
MGVLALDIGGAYLKAADGLGYADSQYFPLWKQPDGLAAALRRVVDEAPPTDRLAATMTGELADCYNTKTEGVSAILAALGQVADQRELGIYLTDGTIVPSAVARSRPLEAAAANWHVLARFAARYVRRGGGLLLDIGSTTCDIIPLVGSAPAAVGRTDSERMLNGELVYTGVERSPVCAVATAFPWRGQQCPTAHEVFATTLDAYLILGDLPEDPSQTNTADGRPAMRAAARDRLARSICADRDAFSDDDAEAAAAAIARAQAAKISVAVQGVVRRMPMPPTTIVMSGQGEFLARRLLDRMRLAADVISLADKLGPEVSRCATAHALAVTVRESTRP